MQSDDVVSSSRRIVTLEQFIVDTFSRIGEDGIERPVDQPDQIGGGGTYAIIGARIFVSPCRLGMIVDYTSSTLPESMRDTLERFGEEMWAFRGRADGHPTASAINRYQGQTRGFEYLTEPLLLTPLSLLNTAFGDPLPSAVHFISYPAPRAERVLSEITSLNATKGWNPMVIWEPEAESLEVIGRVSKDIDVIGPNHHEVSRLLPSLLPTSSQEEHLRDFYSQACIEFLKYKPKIGVVVRCGHLGCCFSTTPDPTSISCSPSKIEVKWIPAYWHLNRKGWNEGRVVDPTGAGNAFMGGLAAALDSGESLDEAVIWGSVAASFTIEQDGLPTLTRKNGKELWNGEDPWDRVQEMQRDVGNLP
ncbi:uncharacterized protein IL334_004756 [Kwoniella shivajii]|uniref:Carbohydrate kinase PfkB domain-containing protein n=1 Tax=Kwoniella shivajii TaxID=564305 RepID=A0ABZ1D576_9TREE|nr:hypothetical protein IL334_004756 [Kwoniella shivajii]